MEGARGGGAEELGEGARKGVGFTSAAARERSEEEDDAMGGAARNYSRTILPIRWVPRSFPLIWVNGWVLLLELVLHTP
jgi:hypothetical protein